MINVNNKVDHKIWKQVYDQVSEKVHVQIWKQVGMKLEINMNNVKEQVTEQIMAIVCERTYDEIDDEIIQGKVVPLVSWKVWDNIHNIHHKIWEEVFQQ